MASSKSKTIQKIIYRIEVLRNPNEPFDTDMEYLTTDPPKAYAHLKSTLKIKYPNHKINLTEITETKTYKPITESELEKIAKK